ncbi:hypothetical protein P152DRAFT_472090 [Eremomyces bilateralis CBS 781.70]|uniref:tRNA(Ile)-lysidine synthetase n=1 Tax=Eremomyces bilateralis CBS 781.70 TaxID=1392243 RepID=A0A6G1G882_9PEZI|nr:uncharacterized protein P152DRAFT_472090 [Eremomyces bilateralis CBS 781.70]KAF1814315.1 hypothetical protein P152DRAFT_472090 [Eremomyces bilateralis CBS 781.70]
MRLAPTQTLRCGSITLEHLHSALSKALDVGHHGSRSQPRHLAVAVSGGIDSMVLAVLLGKLCMQERWRLTAITIDHGARAESAEDARWVEHELSTVHGISTIRRPLVWPGNLSPSDPHGFETRARRLRYQMLGRTCASIGAHHLLVGHHKDDRAESVLQRLIQGHGTVGLGRALKPFAAIPECESIYGVDASGEGVRFPTGHQPLQGTVSMFETGGVSVVRPLLGFTKAVLSKTARDLKIEHREDATNRDPTLTVRNAIRQLFRAENVPQALRSDALVSLSDSCGETATNLDAAAATLISQAAMGFNPQSGALTVTFPDFFYLDFHSEAEREEHLHRLVVMLQRIISVVSTDKPRFTRLKDVARQIFQRSPLAGLPSKAFHAAGAAFMPIATRPLAPAGIHAPLGAATMGQERVMTGLAWRITPKVTPKVLRRFELDPPNAASGHEQDFHLIDSRYWLRMWRERDLAEEVSRSSSVAAEEPPHDACHRLSVVVRYLTESDIASIQSRIDAKSRSVFRNMLKANAPGSVRFTLLVIAIPDDGISGNSEDCAVIALPTIGWKLDKAKLNPANSERDTLLYLKLQRLASELDWEVRYRSLHPDIVSALRTPNQRQ